MSESPEIEETLEAVRRRCNRLLVRRLALRVLLIGSGSAALGSIFWIARGESVPGGWLFGVAVMTIGLGLSFLHHGWMDRPAAARFADEHFGLKDGLATSLFLESEGGAAEALQRRWLSERLADCRVESIGGPLPRRMLAAGLVALAAAVVLGLWPPSAEVLTEREEERATREAVAESKKELEKLIEELEKDIVAIPDVEGLEMDEFRKLVAEIEETGDRAEAARQFARIEQKVRTAARALDQRRDEQTLELAAQELGKAEETEPRKLGKELEEKDWKEAEEMMKKLAEMKMDPQELKDPAKLEDAKKELARMRAVTKRLAAAGKQRQAAGALGGGAGAANGMGGEGAAGAGGEGATLEELMAEMDEAAQEMEEALGEMEFDPDAEWADGEFDGPHFRAKGALDRFRGKLRKMHGQREALGKLDQLRAALAQASGMGQAPGGREPGSGSSWSERQEKDNSQENGAMAQLQGQHGTGPSLSAVEDAESGSGVSGRRGTAREREFSKQVESFVQRDDVPEALKLGVRNYFENVQAAASAGREDGE